LIFKYLQTQQVSKTVKKQGQFTLSQKQNQIP